MFSTVFLVPGGMSRMTRPAQRRKGTSCQPPTASSPWQTPQRRLRAPSQVFKSPNADGNDSHWALGPCSRDRMRSTVKTTTMPPLMLQGLDMCKGCRRSTVASTCFLLLFDSDVIGLGPSPKARRPESNFPGPTRPEPEIFSSARN